MRRLIIAATAFVALAGAMSIGGRAEAMTLPGGLSAGTGAAAERVALVCRNVWNGYGWVRRCYRTRPAYYGYGGGYYPPPAYYAPRPYYGYGGYGYGYRRPGITFSF